MKNADLFKTENFYFIEWANYYLDKNFLSQKYNVKVLL